MQEDGGPLNKEETKEALKEAINEWLDKQFARFGWWSAMTFSAAVLCALTYFILRINGWHK